MLSHHALSSLSSQPIPGAMKHIAPNDEPRFLLPMTSEKRFLNDIQTLRERVRQHIKDGAVEAGHRESLDTILQLLNDVLAAKLVGVQRYQRYQFLAGESDTAAIDAQFVNHSSEEQVHADQIAERIGELGGTVEHSWPGTVSGGTTRVIGNSFIDLLKEDMIAECIAMDIFREVIAYLGDRDHVTRGLLETIVAVQGRRADEIAGLLECMPMEFKE